MEVSLTQSRNFFGRYTVKCSVAFTELEYAVVLTQGLKDREVLNWWKWNGVEKQPDPIKGHHLLHPVSRTFKTQGEANHFQEQLDNGLKNFKRYLAYSTKPIPNKTYRL